MAILIKSWLGRTRLRIHPTPPRAEWEEVGVYVSQESIRSPFSWTSRDVSGLTTMARPLPTQSWKIIISSEGVQV